MIYGMEFFGTQLLGISYLGTKVEMLFYITPHNLFVTYEAILFIPFFC